MSENEGLALLEASLPSVEYHLEMAREGLDGLDYENSGFFTALHYIEQINDLSDLLDRMRERIAKARGESK